MRVLITDKAKWLGRVEASIKAIEDKRAEENSAIEAEWSAKYNSRPAWLRWLIGPQTPEPPHGWEGGHFYPSIYAWGSLATLKKVRKALNEPDTGDIYLTAGEIKVIH